MLRIFADGLVVPSFGDDPRAPERGLNVHEPKSGSEIRSAQQPKNSPKILQIKFRNFDTCGAGQQST